MVRSWVVGPGRWQSGIFLPRVSLAGRGVCYARRDYLCTRMAGHTGRHAATGSSGEVLEVWE